jgi:hypothetical protein
VIDGKECLNLASHNYLGFAGNETIEEAAIECVKKFGVGSCGPRAFYGTAGFTKFFFDEVKFDILNRLTLSRLNLKKQNN